MQKNSTENTANRNGRRNHPRECNVARNITSTGNVTISRVIMTSFGLGLSLREADKLDDGNKAAACNSVDKRETKMEPTLPGKPGDTRKIGLGMEKSNKPLMTMASNGKPS